jgi:hypothetical protein
MDSEDLEKLMENQARGRLQILSNKKSAMSSQSEKSEQLCKPKERGPSTDSLILQKRTENPKTVVMNPESEIVESKP